MGFAGAARQFVKAKWYFTTRPCKGLGNQTKAALCDEFGVTGQLMPGKLHQLPFKMVEIGFGCLIANPQFFPDLVIKIFQQLLARAGHGRIDLHT